MKLKMCVISSIVSLLSAFFVCAITIILVLFVVTVPVNNSIETASDGITSLYSGAVNSYCCSSGLPNQWTLA